MKKLPFLLSFLTIFFLAIIYPSQTNAQGCGDIFGSNVATNWYRENLEFIRNQANCSGPIPIEVIITPAERDNHQLLLDLEKNLRELNFVPTWRPWGNGMPRGSELQAWIDAASVLSIGQFQLFNEPNNCYFGCFSGSTPDPVADAQAALVFLEASEQGKIKIPLALMPLSPRTPNYGSFLSEQNYWTQFNNACGGCVKDFDYIGLNVYPLTSPGANPNANVDKFISDFSAQLNFFASLGVNTATTRFVITEAGLDPGMYEGNFEQRVRDTIAFAQALEARVKADPSLFLNVDQITFFIMDENTNKQYLIYRQCDDAGNCEWVVDEYKVYNINVPGVPFIPGEFSQLDCNPDLTGERDSRPYYNIPQERACDLCNLTGLFCSSCATSFAVHDTVTYKRGAGAEEPPHCVEKSWEGTVTIDPTNTKIPFVGKKGEESEEKYLADYFEGTNEYYENYSHYWKDWINYAGVWRKLSPMSYQNILKKQMVERAEKSLALGNQPQVEGIHDYQLNYIGRLCWDAPFWIEVINTVLGKIAGAFGLTIPDVTNFCLFEDSENHPEQFALIQVYKYTIRDLPFINDRYNQGVTATLSELEEHLPPDPFEENYPEKWDEWKKSDGGKWYKLWQVVPMFSHEDTPGQILPYLGYKSKDEPKFIPPEVEKVPHVARLYEATQEVQTMLTPFYQEDLLFTQNKAKSTLASSKTFQPTTINPTEKNILGEKALLAQGEACQECPELSIANPGISNGMVHYTYLLCHSCPGHGVIGDVFVGPCGGVSQMKNIPPPCFSTNHPAIAPPVPISCRGTANICIAFKCDSSEACPGCWGQWQSESCQVTVDEGCNITDTTCGAVAVEPPVCGISGPAPVMDCEQAAITDPNEKDDLCCDPITITLNAVDAFENPEYEKCRAEGITCQPPGCIPGVSCISCDNPCEEKVEKAVSRRFGINLLHPYLTDIWEQTGLAETAGLFNFFRPESEKIPKFREIDASSEIIYTQTGFESIEPSVGKFYFNYLGGVQLAKEWVTRALMPLKSSIEIIH